MRLWGYAVRDLKKRPLAFLPAFLIAAAGMYIVFSTLFMQYGAYRANIARAEASYHVYLPDLTYSQVRAIEELSYVKSVDSLEYEGVYSAYIRLVDNDPRRLKSQCDRIIRDVGLDRTPAYADNPYYNRYGPQDSWINGEYYRLATAFFYGDTLFLLFPLLVLTLLGLYQAVVIKLKHNLDEYGALRAMGMRISGVLTVILLQYLAVLTAAMVLAVMVSALTLYIFSDFTLSRFSSDFQLFAKELPVREALATALLSATMLLLFLPFLAKHLRRPIHAMLTKAPSHTVAHGDEPPFLGRPGIGAYNRLLLRRTRRELAGEAFKQFVLFLLPFLFVAQSVIIYGMRDQGASVDYDYVLFYSRPYRVTREVIDDLAAYEEIASFEPINPYEDGSWGGVRICAAEGQEEAVAEIVKSLADYHHLQMTDLYHGAQMTRLQSDVFSVFYLMQAAILLFAATLISLTNARYRCLRRTEELSTLRAMGLSAQQLSLLYLPDLAVSCLPLPLAAAVSCIGWFGVFGLPYLKAGYLVAVLLGALSVCPLAHLLLYRKERQALLCGSLSQTMKEVS